MFLFVKRRTLLPHVPLDPHDDELRKACGVARPHGPGSHVEHSAGPGHAVHQAWTEAGKKTAPELDGEALTAASDALRIGTSAMSIAEIGTERLWDTTGRGKVG